ncbi:serpentine type 7TM GPCR chemoreceptor srt domain-containing protein [Ditylenchus destructor]|uniref:Serpentine type 7TM GPCR chemoreceptor srt domain-containing protein n=1 Tax=Ditylenchus destructor TaxID=166010 RepID=A0AAD4QV41_9BILA|nr:serpentine type 7TM GPCR chemoreceptor srt domain-containing protein [Ditylenchus destructor]
MSNYGALGILFHPEAYHRYYNNCTVYDVDAIPLQQRQHPLLGTVYIILFLIYETSLLLCLPSIWKRMRESSCYKIMFYMTILDITALPVIALGSGVLMFLGLVFCSNPTLLYAMALPAPIFWYCETVAAVLLAFNRCLDVISFNWSDKLFGGRRTWIWMILPTIYGIERLIFAKTVIFSGVIGCWHLNPHVGYLADNENVFDSQELAQHDLVTIVCLLGLYSIFCLRVMCETEKSSKINDWKTNGSKKVERRSLFLQVLLISINHLATAALYTLMIFVPTCATPWLASIAQLVWISAHGLPGVVYLTMNNTIRKDVKAMLGTDFHRWKVSNKTSAASNSFTSSLHKY